MSSEEALALVNAEISSKQPIQAIDKLIKILIERKGIHNAMSNMRSLLASTIKEAINELI